MQVNAGEDASVAKDLVQGLQQSGSGSESGSSSSSSSTEKSVAQKRLDETAEEGEAAAVKKILQLKGLTDEQSKKGLEWCKGSEKEAAVSPESDQGIWKALDNEQKCVSAAQDADKSLVDRSVRDMYQGLARLQWGSRQLRSKTNRTRNYGKEVTSPSEPTKTANEDFGNENQAPAWKIKKKRTADPKHCASSLRSKQFWRGPSSRTILASIPRNDEDHQRHQDVSTKESRINLEAVDGSSRENSNNNPIELGGRRDHPTMCSDDLISHDNRSSPGATHPAEMVESRSKPLGAKAISRRGHTCRGRVRQKPQKSVELVGCGTLHAANGWFNAGYIFPDGFKSRTNFRSSVDLSRVCIHECEIVGKTGKYYPSPTFVVKAYDRPTEPLVAKSCTGCWTAVLKRINREIARLIKEGHNLPPPPKTAIAGPEYFGLVQTNIVEAIEGLDPDHLCDLYWNGKEDRRAAKESLGDADQLDIGQRGLRAAGNPHSGNLSRKRARHATNDNSDAEGEYTLSIWTRLGRRERYKKRCLNRGIHVEDIENDDNPMPAFIDPITLEAVISPAVSPFGHVMGLATWKAVLCDQRRCPFTKQSLSHEQCILLTKSNFEKYKDRIIHL